VIRPYRDLTEIMLERTTDKYRYPKAIKIIERLRDSYHRSGDDTGFTAYVADLRQRHRRKTSFVTKLDQTLSRRPLLCRATGDFTVHRSWSCLARTPGGCPPSNLITKVATGCQRYSSARRRGPELSVPVMPMCVRPATRALRRAERCSYVCQP
jgi:hypothetical protein